MFERLKAGVIPRRRTAASIDPRIATQGRGDAVFDEFGAPEGGFGRLDVVLTELKSAHGQLTASATAEPVSRASLGA